MGKRGPKKQFEAVTETAFTRAQIDYIDQAAALSGQSRSAVIRSMVDDRIDIAEGRYSPYPESLPEMARPS
jgi:hypothetical protein